MEHTLLLDALNLSLFGMGFVFLFLILLVFVMRLMSIIIQKTSVETQSGDARQNNLNLSGELDEETKFVIEQAIKMHRGA